MKTVSSNSPVEFTGYTTQGDEVIEWCDDEVEQHGVQVSREWRHLPDLFFYFGMQEEAHALFMALCQAETIAVSGDELENVAMERRMNHVSTTAN